MIKILTLCALLSITLFARINPFEADPLAKKVEEKTIIDPEIKKIILNNEDDGNRTVKVVNEAEIVSKPAIKEVKPIINKPIKESLSKIEIEKLCKTDIDKKIPKPKVVKKITKPKPKAVKKPFIAAIYKVLPFLTIEVNKNDIKIISSKKYRIFRHIKLKKSQKVVIDFTGKASFYTKKKDINTVAFKSYRVGNHKKENFFRVAIDIKQDLKYYKLIMENNVAHLIYK